MNHEDHDVFHYIRKVDHNPTKKSYQDKLLESYSSARDLKKLQIKQAIKNEGKGDRWKVVLNDLLILQEMHDKINASPAASAVILDAKDYSSRITKVREKGALEYYELGELSLSYGTREHAQKAYSYYIESSNMIRSYKDVDAKIVEAKKMGTLHVVVNSVNYNNYDWGHYGFQDDYIQRKIVSDLNARSYVFTKFYDLKSSEISDVKIDYTLNVVIDRLYLSPPAEHNDVFDRVKKVKVGETRSEPPKPIYETYKAIMFVYERTLFAEANLFCEIISEPSNRLLYSEQFPSQYNWTKSWGRYTGDQRALTSSDWVLINNNQMAPSDNYITRELMDLSYEKCIQSLSHNELFY